MGNRAGFVAMVLAEEKAGIQRMLRGSNVSYLVKPFSIQGALALVAACGSGVDAQSETRTGDRE